MANGDIFVCSFVGGNGQINTVNTWHYKDNSGGATEIDTHGFAIAFAADVGPKLANVLGVDWTSEYTRVQCIAGPHTGDLGYYYTAAYSGILTGDPLPPELCVLLKRTTGHAARSTRGRMFVGPVCTDLMTSVPNGQVNITFGGFTALLSTLSAGFTIDTVGLDSVLVSKKPYVATAPIINTTVAPGLGHRKSRRDKVFVV